MEEHGIRCGSAFPIGKFGLFIPDCKIRMIGVVTSDIRAIFRFLLYHVYIQSIGVGRFAFVATMPHLPITNLFDASVLQINPLEEDIIGSQEVVNYFEARFRIALQYMVLRCENEYQWMYKMLFEEMVIFVACHYPHFLIRLTLATMFLLYRGGSCDWPASQHSRHYQIAWPRHVPSRDDPGW